MPNLVMRFDMRCPPFGAAKADLYAAALDMAAWADEKGFHTIQFAEHHGAEDGYLPSPIPLAAAMAGRTRRVRLRFGLIILPLHDPLRLAEDLAVLDCLSGGRIDVVFGAGYARHEFAMFGIEPADRPRLMEEGIAAVKQAWTGEPFTHRGRRVQVRPTPLQQPRPPIWMGGSSPAAARRAARLADYFYTGEQALYDLYRAEAVRLGRDPGPWRDIGAGFLVVADDPDAEWARLAPHIEHEVRSYRSWIGQSGDDVNAYQFVDLAEVRAAGAYPILRPDEARAYADARGPDGDLTLHPLPGGLDPAVAWRHLERFDREILPHVRGAAPASA